MPRLFVTVFPSHCLVLRCHQSAGRISFYRPLVGLDFLFVALAWASLVLLRSHGS